MSRRRRLHGERHTRLARRGAMAAGLAALGLLLAASASAEWGGDFEPGAGEELIDWIRPDLAAIVAATPERRTALVEAFAASGAADTIEAVKRFRNPELLPLFHRLLRHPDWRVVHRTLLALERMEDAGALPAAWGQLAHDEPRLREKAAVTCLRLWGVPGADVPKDAVVRLRRLLAQETVPAVGACLRALAARAEGTLHVERVSEEVRVAGEDGLVSTPFLRRMSEASRVAPGYVPRYVARAGDGSASRLAVVRDWRAPLLDAGCAPLPRGRRLQRFGEPRNGGRSVHTGVDVGAFLDGAGLYACGAGLVKWVYTGSDMGTEIVLEHHVEPTVSADGLVTVLYMHAADVVFVAAGDLVEAGQLLGSMGLGHSFENGGHFAHLHLGACPGPFRTDHVYGYKPSAEGLSDWLDPATFIPGVREALGPLRRESVPGLPPGRSRAVEGPRRRVRSPARGGGGRGRRAPAGGISAPSRRCAPGSTAGAARAEGAGSGRSGGRTGSDRSLPPRPRALPGSSR